MNYIKWHEKNLETKLKEIGYDSSVLIFPCSKRELGDFQINIAMSLAKKYHKNPQLIAEEIVKCFDLEYVDVNIANPGFINFKFSDDSLLNYVNSGVDDFNNLIEKHNSQLIFLDYGGANAAKALHVGHMRSPNIGEAMKRLANMLGDKTISDVHLGDLGRQAGMLISEIKRRGDYPEFFSDNYKGEFPKVKYTSADLGELYVSANIKAKEDEKVLQEVRDITAAIDSGDTRYIALWKQLINISIVDIKAIYDKLNCTFDLWEGELDSFKDVPKMLQKLDKYLYSSNGALVIDVKKDTDTKEMPPLIVIKNDGATIYATRDLATIYSREERFHPDEIWYFTDNRQSLYFEQVFRASYIGKLIPNTCKLKHFPFGTINGYDGKPYKTRDGGVMELANLIKIISLEIDKKLTKDLDNREEIKEKLAIAALKYADLSSYRETDYVFDEVKFSSFDGKTGPYILYTVVRLKSLLKKSPDKKYHITKINNLEIRDILLKVLELSNILNRSYEDKSLNYLADYLFDLASLFNKFYNNHYILNEKDLEIKNTYLGVCKLVYNILHNILNILAIEEVDKM